MAQRITRKHLKHDEVLEAAWGVEHWVVAHWRRVAAGALVLLALGLLGLGWGLWSHRRAEDAARHLREGLRLFHPSPAPPGEAAAPAPRYAEALAAFEKAADLGGSRMPGLVATYYRGAALLRMGRGADAARVLEALAPSGRLGVLAGPAKALLAQAYLAAGESSKGEAVWRELSQGKTPGYPAEMALLELGRALRSQGKEQEARQAWQEVVARFPQSAAAEEARGEISPGGSPGAQ